MVSFEYTNDMFDIDIGNSTAAELKYSEYKEKPQINLLDYKGKDANDKNGYNALCYACGHGVAPEVIAFLVTKDFKLDKCSRGKSPAQLACEALATDALKAICGDEIEFLHKKDSKEAKGFIADRSRKDSISVNSGMYKLTSDDLLTAAGIAPADKIVEYIVENKNRQLASEILAPDSSVTKSGSIYKYIFNYIEFFNTASSDGYTPLMLAVNAQSYGSVDALLSTGSTDIRATTQLKTLEDEDQMNAIQIAESLKDSGLTSTLTDKFYEGEYNYATCFTKEVIHDSDPVQYRYNNFDSAFKALLCNNKDSLSESTPICFKELIDRKFYNLCGILCISNKLELFHFNYLDTLPNSTLKLITQWNLYSKYELPGINSDVVLSKDNLLPVFFFRNYLSDDLLKSINGSIGSYTSKLKLASYKDDSPIDDLKDRLLSLNCISTLISVFGNNDDKIVASLVNDINGNSDTIKQILSSDSDLSRKLLTEILAKYKSDESSKEDINSLITDLCIAPDSIHDNLLSQIDSTNEDDLIKIISSKINLAKLVSTGCVNAVMKLVYSEGFTDWSLIGNSDDVVKRIVDEFDDHTDLLPYYIKNDCLSIFTGLANANKLDGHWSVINDNIITGSSILDYIVGEQLISDVDCINNSYYSILYLMYSVTHELSTAALRLLNTDSEIDLSSLFTSDNYHHCTSDSNYNSTSVFYTIVTNKLYRLINFIQLNVGYNKFEVDKIVEETELGYLDMNLLDESLRKPDNRDTFTKAGTLAFITAPFTVETDLPIIPAGDSGGDYPTDKIYFDVKY